LRDEAHELALQQVQLRVAFTEIPKRELRGMPGYPTPLLVGNHALHSKKSHRGN